MLVLFRAGYGERELTIMVDGWARSTATQPTSELYWGYVPLIGISPGQTVLRAWWNIGIHLTVGDANPYPPGASALRAGLAFIPEADITGLKPTPISNADADWMAITCLPLQHLLVNRDVDLVTWQFNWGFELDQSIKSQRKNNTTGNYSLWLAWEFALKDTIVGFDGFQWWANLDAYLRTPDV